MKKIIAPKFLSFGQKDTNQREEDTQLNTHAKRLESTKANLREIHERLAKKTQLTTPLIDNSRRLGRSFNSFGDFLAPGPGEDPELGECLAKVGLLEILLSDLLEKWGAASVDKLEDPINEFIKGEISAAEQEKKQYDKAKATFEAADSKLRQLKSKEDAKAFDIEKERNVLQERYLESRDEAQTALADAYEKNKFYTLEKLCDYVDAQHLYFKSALEAVEATKQKVEVYRRYIAKKKKEYRSTRGAGGGGNQEEADSDGEDDDTGGETVRQGWLHRSVGKSSWKKSWVVIKYKYLYYYSNPDSALGGVVRLTHCSVDVSTRKEFCFAINGRLSSQFFYTKSEDEMKAWIEAVKTCIEEEEAHVTRQLGKEEIKGNAWIEEEDVQDEPEEEISNVEDPILRLHLQLIRDEKKYLNCLTRVNKMYMVPLTADPRLKGKILPDEVGAIFGNLKPLTMLHTSLLKQLESVQTNQVSAVFLHNLQDIESVYISYLSKLSNGMYSLNASKQRVKAIKQFLTEREEILGEGNELATLLALPVQRVAQYANVLSQLILSGSQDSTLDAAHDALKALTNKLNQCSASSASLGKILDVRRRLHNYDGNLVDPQRRLLREGPVQVQLPAPPAGPGVAVVADQGSKIKRTQGMTATYLFLFNDLLLFTKAPTISRTTYKVVGQLEMHKARLVDEESTTLFKLEEQQRGKHTKVKEYPIQCDSSEDKAAWMTSLLNSIEEMKETRKIYGIPLDELMSTSREKGRDVPTVIEKATEWIVVNALTQEGIFRKAGRLDSIEDYKDLFNQGKAIEFAADADPYVVAGVMNHFLMELPDPLLTTAMYEHFIDSVKGGSASISRLQELIMQLPHYNRYVLQHIMSLLQLVVYHAADNKMTPSNLAIVFGPTLLGSGDQPQSLFADFTANQKVIEAMITNYDTLFQKIVEERKEVKNKLMEEEEAEKKKREMQQKRVTERLTALPVLRQSSVIGSPTNSGEIPVRPSPPGRNTIRKSFLDRGPAPGVPAATSSSPGASHTSLGGNEALLSHTRASLPLLPSGTPPSADAGGPKPLPAVPPARKPLPRPPGAGEAPLSGSTDGGSSLPPLPVGVPPRPGTLRSNTGSGRGRPPVPLPPGAAPPSPPTPGAASQSALTSSSGLYVPGDAELEPLIANIRTLPPGTVVKQGWLTKKGGQRRNWKTRWFVLKTNEFSYYNNKKDAKPKGTIVLSGITVKSSSHKEFCFAVSTTERTYLMGGKDAAEQEEWVASITACLRSLDP